MPDAVAHGDELKLAEVANRSKDVGHQSLLLPADLEQRQRRFRRLVVDADGFEDVVLRSKLVQVVGGVVCRRRRQRQPSDVFRERQPTTVFVVFDGGRWRSVGVVVVGSDVDVDVPQKSASVRRFFGVFQRRPFFALLPLLDELKLLQGFGDGSGGDDCGRFFDDVTVAVGRIVPVFPGQARICARKVEESEK